MSKSSLDIFSLMLGKQTGGGLKASSVTIKSSPSKTKYLQGEALDITGLKVEASVGELSGDVTADVTVIPANGTILTNQTKIDVKYGGVTESIPIEIVQLTGIEVTSNPTKVNYLEGQNLDLTGIAVTGTFSDSSTSDITNQCTFTPASGTKLDTVGTNEITVSCKEFTDTTSITVYAVDSIEITSMPTKVTYKTGESLDLIGLVVMASNSEIHLSSDVTSSCTFNPAEGTVFDEEKTYTISVSYGSLSTSFDVVCQNLPAWDERGLNYNSWETIQTYIKEGLFSTVASVGQTKSFTAGGQTYNAEIVAINDGTGSAGSWYPNKTVDFITKELTNSTYTYGNGSAGGFQSSNIKNVLNNTIYPTLPTDLKSVIVDKSHSYQTGKWSNGTWQSSLTTIVTKLWLPTYYEVTGKTTSDAKDETASNNKKYTMASISKTGSYYWWTSSPDTGMSDAVWCGKQSNSMDMRGPSQNNYGVPICFRVG